MEINILFPVLNEHLRLEKGIRRAMAYIEPNVKIPYHLTIVDNGSDDDTPEIAKRLAQEFPAVEYVRLEQRGVGIAVRTGIERNTADIVGYMDIDLSTDISYLNKTIELFQNHPEIQYVNASRFAKESDTEGRKWYRKITSKGLLILLDLFFHMKSTDAICGFTFVRKEVAERLAKECSNDNGWFYMIEFLLRAERDGINIYDMPVKWQEDYDTTVHIWKTVKNYMKNIFRLKKEFNAEDRQKRKGR